VLVKLELGSYWVKGINATITLDLSVVFENHFHVFPSGGQLYFLMVGMWLGLLYGKMRRPDKAFLSAQPLSHFRLAYRAGLNVLTWVCILIKDDWEITKAVVARSKFLISTFLAGDNCEKLIPCKYFTLFLFLFVLKLPLLRLKYSQMWKQPRKNDYHNASVWKIK
jgi:hypothetical protein